MKDAKTIAAALEKLRQTYAGDLADLIWDKSVKGFDSILAYNPDNDELEIHVFSPGTVWNDDCRSLYLRKFPDPLTIEVMNWTDLGDEFREYDGEVDLSEFAASKGIDLEERYRNIHDFYLVEDSDIIREIMDDLDEQLLPIHYYVDTTAGTMKRGSDDVTEEFFGDTSPSNPENTPESCLDFWLDEGWIVPGDVVKWDGVQVYPAPAPDPLKAAIAAISQDENINQAFRDGLRGLSL